MLSSNPNSIFMRAEFLRQQQALAEKIKKLQDTIETTYFSEEDAEYPKTLAVLSAEYEHVVSSLATLNRQRRFGEEFSERLLPIYHNLSKARKALEAQIDKNIARIDALAKDQSERGKQYQASALYKQYKDCWDQYHGKKSTEEKSYQAQPAVKSKGYGSCDN